MRAFQGLEGARVMVNLTTGDALAGQVAAVGRDHLDLRDTVLQSRETRGALDGAVIVPFERVAWIQVAS